jgi:hypothetical protein
MALKYIGMKRKSEAQDGSLKSSRAAFQLTFVVEYKARHQVIFIVYIMCAIPYVHRYTQPTEPLRVPLSNTIQFRSSSYHPVIALCLQRSK